jgi:hypothetical protein
MERSGPLARLAESYPLLCLALGSYAAILTATTLALTAGRDLTAVTNVPLAAVVGVVVTTAAWSVPDLSVTLSRTRVHHLLVAVPLLVIGTWMAADYTTIGIHEGFVPDTALFGYGVALVPAGAVLAIANNRHVEAIVDGRTPDVEWVAGKPPSHEYGTVLAWGGGFVVVVAGILVDVLSGELLASLVGMAIGRALAGGSSGTDRRGFAVYPDGLVVEQTDSRGRKVYPWSRFTGYTLTEEELRLHRGLGRPAIRCRRSDIEDERAVRRALDLELRRVAPSSSILHRF